METVGLLITQVNIGATPQDIIIMGAVEIFSRQTNSKTILGRIGLVVYKDSATKVYKGNINAWSYRACSVQGQCYQSVQR